MTDYAASPPHTALAGPRPLYQPLLCFCAALPLLALGLWVLGGVPRLIALSSGGALVILAFLLSARSLWARRAALRDLRRLAALIADDPAPTLCTDDAGLIRLANGAAETRFGLREGQSLQQALASLMVNPSALMLRHSTAVREHGHASETVFTRQGHLQVLAHRGGDAWLIWRLEETAAAPGRVGEGLALPMLTANANGAILSMNAAMRVLLGHRPRHLESVLGQQQPTTGAQVSLEAAEGTVDATLLTFERDAAEREIYAVPGFTAPQSVGLSDEVFGALPVAALKLAPTGEVLASNRGAETLLRFVLRGEAVRLCNLVEGPGRAVRDWLKDLVEGRGANQPQVVRALRREDDCNVKITLGTFREAGETRFLAVLEDATDMQFLQQQVAQSQKMQAVGELAGGVAHDFNNLLTAITGHCDLLLLRHDQGDQDYADLVQIHQNANRAASLVGQLLAFSRKQTMKLELIDLRDTMADLTHLLNRLVGERVTLQLSQDPALQPIRADRRLLDQVLVNLVVNARDAMPDGGLVRIVSRMVHVEDAIRRGGADVPPGDYVMIEVADEGTGIPPDRLSRIFEPFFTTKRVGEGTGLGLSMAYGIVKQSGGYIFADSQVGVGTRFEIYFPAHEWPAQSDPRAETAEHAKSDRVGEDATGVVLLVEDEAPVRAFASRALRLKGFSVLEADSGDAALELLEDDALEIDLFVTDMIMPGKGGPEWVREALQQRPGVGVVFMSGYAEDAYGKFSQDIPKAVFLAKPFSLADLTETVRQQLH